MVLPRKHRVQSLEFRYSCYVKNNGDAELVQILDAAFADSARRSGALLVCHAGCTQCCVGAFAISQLDAHRLRSGLAELRASDSPRAEAVVARAQSYVGRLAHEFPGDVETGLLHEDEEAQARFEEFANDEPCPALDPNTGLCDLYAHRPTTCRVFGPPVRSGEEGGLGVCELCYHGATAEEIAACEMEVDLQGLEEKLIADLESQTGRSGNTIVAFSLIEDEPTRLAEKT